MSAIAKYRDHERPGKWFLTDFTMEQVEGRLGHLEEENERLRADLIAAQQAAPEDLRAKGWSVAVHNDYRNDYRIDGHPFTFWLMTHPSGRWLKGEGASDEVALNQIRAVIQQEEDKRKPSKGCNMHADCAAAEAEAAKAGKPARFGSASVRLDHCNDEGCEDCFGC